MEMTTEISAHTAITVCESISGTPFREMPLERGEAPDLHSTRCVFFDF